MYTFFKFSIRAISPHSTNHNIYRLLEIIGYYHTGIYNICCGFTILGVQNKRAEYFVRNRRQQKNVFKQHKRVNKCRF